MAGPNNGGHSGELDVGGTGSVIINGTASLKLYGANSGTAVVNQGGGAVTVSPTSTNGVFLANTSATYNLNGGVLNAAKLTPNGSASQQFNFGGGTLALNGNLTVAASTGFTTNINAGGATINTNGYAATWNTPLLAGLVNRVTGITGLTGGSGYTSEPTVTFTGGSGSGAAAQALIANGAVVGIVITNPGTGYTSAPTIGFSGGGGSGAGATALATTAAGGLTKIGSGTLSLTAANTYTGGTTVAAGTLLLSGAVNMPATGALTVNPAATFSLADGTVRTTNAASLNLNSGSNLTFDWIGGAADTLVSTAAATTAGYVAINLNPSSPSGSGLTLISSPNGGLSGAAYCLVNNTNYTAAINQSATAVTIGSYSTASTLSTAYWLGGQVAGAGNVLNLSNGTLSNWASAATGTATGVVPAAGTNVIFSTTSGASNEGALLAGNMAVNGITFNDSAAVSISSTDSTAYALTVNGGGLAANGAAGAVTINVPFVMGAAQTWAVNNAGGLTASGGISGGLALALTGTGHVTLGGVNAVSGFQVNGATVNGGTTEISGTVNSVNASTAFYIGNGDAMGSDKATLLIDNGAIVNVTGTLSDSIVVGRDSGSGTVVQNGGLFNYNPTSASNIYITASNNANSNSFYYMNGGTLNLNGKILYIGFGSGTVATGTFIQTGGTVTGVGTMDVGVSVGKGYYTMTGGQLVVGTGGIVGASTYGINLGGGSVAASGNWSSAALMTLTGSNGNVSFDTTGGSITLSGALSGTGGLTKIGTGTLTLSGPSTYSGVTTINSGTLLVSGALNPAAGLVLNLGGVLNTNGANLPLSNYLSLAGNSFNISSGTFTVNGSAVTSSAATLALNGGTILLTPSSGSTFASTSTNLSVNGTTTLNLSNAASATLGLATVANGQTLNLTSSGSSTYLSAVTGNGGLGVTGTGTVTIGTATSSFTGATTIPSGTLALGVNNALPAATSVIVSGGTLSLGTFNNTVAGVSLQNGAIAGTSGVLASTTAYDLRNGTVNANLGGTSGLSKSTTGSVTLLATSSYGGPTAIAAGSLAFGINNALPAATTVTLTGGTLALGTFNSSVGGVSLQGGNITGSSGVLTSATAFDVQSGSIAAILGGSAGLTKSMPGLVTLAGVNTYTGPTTVNLGTLALNAGASLAAGSTVAVNNGGTLGGAGTVNGSVTVNNLGHLAPSFATGSTVNSLTVNGALDLNNGASLDLLAAILSGSNDVSDQIVGNSGNILTLPASGLITVNLTNAGSLGNGSYTLLSGFGSIVGSPSSAFVVGSSPLSNRTYTFAETGGNSVTLNIANLMLSIWQGGGADTNWGTAGNWQTGNLPSNAYALTFAGTNTANNNNLAAGTSFGNITFDPTAGAFNLSGNTITLAGDITNSSTNSQTISLPVTLAGLRTINTGSYNMTLAGPLGGPGTLIKAGPGTLFLAAGNAYSGATTIKNGTLQLAAAARCPAPPTLLSGLPAAAARWTWAAKTRRSRGWPWIPRPRPPARSSVPAAVVP